MTAERLTASEAGLLGKALGALGVPRVDVQINPASQGDIHILLNPGLSQIVCGQKWIQSNPTLRKTKLVHEVLHAAGIRHDARSRKLGYYSNPNRDRYSPRVYRQIIGGHKMARRKRRLTAYQRFVQREMRKIRPRSLAEARRAMKAIASQWRSRRRGYANPSPGPRLVRVRAYRSMASARKAATRLNKQGYDGKFYGMPDGGAAIVLNIQPGQRIPVGFGPSGYRGFTRRYGNPDFREGELVRLRGPAPYGGKGAKVVEKERSGILARLRGKQMYHVRVRGEAGPETVLVEESGLKKLNPRGRVTLGRKYLHEHIASVPKGWTARTTTKDGYKVRIAYGGGKVRGRHTKSKLVSILHPIVQRNLSEVE